MLLTFLQSHPDESNAACISRGYITSTKLKLNSSRYAEEHVWRIMVTEEVRKLFHHRHHSSIKFRSVALMLPTEISVSHLEIAM